MPLDPTFGRAMTYLAVPLRALLGVSVDVLSDADVDAVVAYLRNLADRREKGGHRAGEVS